MKLQLAVILTALIYACSEPDNSSKSQTESEVPSLFDAQQDALNKAKGVESMLDDAVETREEEMRNQGI